MYRIIFHSLKDGYNVFDSKDKKDIERERSSFQRQGLKVVCIVNYAFRSYVYKCDDFNDFSDDVDDLVFGCEHYIEETV